MNVQVSRASMEAPVVTGSIHTCATACLHTLGSTVKLVRTIQNGSLTVCDKFILVNRGG